MFNLLKKAKGFVVTADISIVMVSYRTGPVFYQAIESALVQDCLRELIIVDNGNPDEVRGELRSWADKEPKLRYYTGHGNVGFAAGCNIGSTHAEGEYLLFLNPDCILKEKSLCKVVAEMESHRDAWLAGICMIGIEGRRENNNKRNLLSPEVAISEVFRLWKLNKEKFPRINIDELDEEETTYVPAISGAFMMMRRYRYIEIGGMDEEYFFHVEDLDFCKQIKIQGGRVLYIPSVKGTHYTSSSDVTNFFIEWHKTKGFQRYFKKHYIGYFGGAFFLMISLAIWTRFLLRMPKILMRETHKKLKFRANKKQMA